MFNSSPIQFCGDQPCIIPLAVSCSYLKQNMQFFGSCCHLEDIIATGGCRVNVNNNGNCAWSPKCGPCDPSEGCNIEYETRSVQPCEVDRFRVLGGTRPPVETPSPTMTPTVNTTGMNITTTPAPSAAATMSPEPSTGPTCPVPTNPPADPTQPPSNSSSPSWAISVTVVAASLYVVGTLVM